MMMMRSHCDTFFCQFRFSHRIFFLFCYFGRLTLFYAASLWPRENLKDEICISMSQLLRGDVDEDSCVCCEVLIKRRVMLLNENKK
jgi:hypothetical protein